MRKDKEILLEKVSDRRQNSNNYYLTLNSVLISFAGYLSTLQFSIWHIMIAIAGISSSIIWVLTLKSCRNLNSSKFKMIHKMEQDLPAKLFKEEWDCLDRGKNGKIYRKLSVVEQGIPIMFIVLYSFVILIMLYPLIINLIMRLF